MQYEILCRHVRKENLVAAHLHRDEKTPHMHITLVPNVKSGHRKREEQAKKRYRKKPTATVRLCADDIMSRLKLNRIRILTRKKWQNMDCNVA